MSLPTFLVEDNITIRKNLIPAMKDLGDVEVVGVAGTEPQAVAWLTQMPDQWELAVVDLFLSEGSGMGVLHGCRGRRPGQRVVILTNYATTSIRQRCLQMGADAIFDKSTELEAFFDYCLQQSRANKQRIGPRIEDRTIPRAHLTGSRCH